MSGGSMDPQINALQACERRRAAPRLLFPGWRARACEIGRCRLLLHGRYASDSLLGGRRLRSSLRAAGVASRIGQRPPIENGRRAVAHLTKEYPQLAIAIIRAVFAPPVLSLADTRQQCQRSFHQPDHSAKGDGFGALRELVPSAPATLTSHQPVPLEFDQNGFEKLDRDVAPGGDRRRG